MPFYLNYFSVASLVPTLFTLLGGIFFFSLKNKSKGTFFFSIAMLFGALMMGGYVLASTFYHQSMAYHRYMTVIGSLFSHVAFIQFFFYFPSPYRPKLARTFLIVHGTVSAAITINFIVQSFSAPLLYHFDGHHWDFDLPTATKIVGFFFIFNIVVATALSIIQFRRATERRWAVLIIGIVLAIGLIVPTVLNIISRAGIIGRDTFVSGFSVCIVSTFFVMLIAYINSAREKTTFMAKIVGLSLVIFFLVFQFYSMSTFVFKEKSYDELNRARIALWFANNTPIDGFEYRATYSTDEQKITRIKRKNSDTVHLEKYTALYQNTFTYEQLRLLEGQAGASTAAQQVLASTGEYFTGYRKVLSERLAQNTGIAELLRFIETLDQEVYFYYLQLKKIPVNENLKSKLKEFAGKDAPAIAPFKKALGQKLKTTSETGEKLKETALKYFARLAPAGTRFYRHGKDNHYTAYINVDLAEKKVYETGLSYLAYREYLHPSGVWAVLVLFATVALLLSYRFFLKGALSDPLDNLLEGVSQVNEGDFEVHVPIKVEDEIGFLSHSFNKMVTSIREANAKLREYANELEDRVKERTRELNNTLEEVKALKVKQDGDYFLTSLLIRPLGTIQVDSETVSVESYIRQYKGFRFRKWKTDIGGDLNVARSVELHNRKYTIFMNSDAMGKSLQGAGGALVLGAVFQSIIERTLIMKSVADQYPERWLKNTFLELHKSFESFDGSMLVSLCLGVLDDETGILYYINAEHPFGILYRDKTAAFIEKELLFRKLGTTGLSGELSIATYQLEPGDVLILGSDGRDDISLGEDDSGNRIINEDHTKILEHIENADADLHAIVSELEKMGEFADDLSLLRIGFKEEHIKRSGEVLQSEQLHRLVDDARRASQNGDTEGAITLLEKAVSIDDKEPVVLRELIRLHLRKKNYEQAADYAESYMVLRPVDSEMIYVAAYCNKMTRDFNRAIDLGERVKLRHPEEVKNLINLADVYAILQNYKRAEEIVDKVLELSPGNAKAEKIKSLVQNRQMNQGS